MSNSHALYSKSSPDMRAAMIKDGLLHFNASLQRMATEARKLNAWLNEFPQDNEAGKVEDINSTTLHHNIDSFSSASDELTNQIIAMAQNLDVVKVHLLRKAIKSLNQ